MKKKFTSLVLAIMVLFSSGLISCMGSYQLVTGLNQWNRSVSDSKVVNQLIFWLLVIVPVYEIALLGDHIIFNLIEFWSGSNPLAMNDGEIDERQISYQGNNYVMSATKNRLEVYAVNENGIKGELLNYMDFDETDKSWTVGNKREARKILKVLNMDNSSSTFEVYGDQTEIVDVSNTSINQAIIAKGLY